MFHLPLTLSVHRRTRQCEELYSISAVAEILSSCWRYVLMCVCVCVCVCVRFASIALLVPCSFLHLIFRFFFCLTLCSTHPHTIRFSPLISDGLRNRRSGWTSSFKRDFQFYQHHHDDSDRTRRYTCVDVCMPSI